MKVTGGFIDFLNTSSAPTNLKKGSTFADIVKLQELDPVPKANIDKVIEPSSDNSHYDCPRILLDPASYLEQIIVDFDDQLNISWKSKFKSLCGSFFDTINPFPGRYSGYYRDIDNSIDFYLIATPICNGKITSLLY